MKSSVWSRPVLATALFMWLLAGLLPMANVDAGPRIQSWETPNGARVLFVEAPELPMVDVRVVLDAGSARDGERPGLAALTNVLLTQGAGDWNADRIAERLEGVGAELGQGALRDMAWISLRALTRPEVLSTALETMTAVIGQPRFRDQDLGRERQRVLVSLRQTEQKPGTVGKKAFYHQVFGTHPYASYPSGTEASVRGLSRDDLQGFYRKYYVGRNAVVALVGALSREQAEKLAAQVVSGLRPGQPAASLPPVAALGRGVVERIDFPSTQTHVYVGQPGMQRGDPDYFPLYVGNHILGGSGLVSLLAEEVREKRGLSYSVYSYFVPMHRRGPFMMGLQTKNAQADQALEVMMATLRRFVAAGPTEEELQAAKQNITGGFPLRIDSNADIVEYLAMIGFYGLPLDYLDRFTGEIEAVTAARIGDAFRRRVQPDRMVTVIVGPQEDSGERVAAMPKYSNP